MLDLQPFNDGDYTLLEYNPWHGPDGRFTGKGGASTTVAYGGRTARGRGAAGQKAAAVSRHAAKVARSGSMRLAQDNRANGGIGGKEQLAAGRKAAAERMARDFRERAPQNDRAHTSSSQGGKGHRRPSAEARAGMRVARRGQNLRLKQDGAARRASGLGVPRSRSAMGHREGVPQDPGKYTTGKKRTFAGRRLRPGG